MTARFVRVSWGLEYTEAFLEIGKIKSYIQSFQNGREVDDTTKMSESIAWNAQNRMEEEILQTIRTCDTLTKEELFDYLTGWIEYFERNVNSNYSIVQKIKEYNNKRLIEYEKFILEEEKKFRSTKEYKTLNHLDFYEVESNLIMGLIRIPSVKKRLVQYYKFFEIADPSLIDIDFLPKYIEIINPIISRCITIAKSRVSYLKGENSQKILPPQQEQLNELPVPETLTKAKGIKLKTSLTSGQILYLFKTLKGIGVLEGQISNIDVCRFIAANLSTVGAEELSPENLAKVWSNIDPNDIAFWSNKFPDMSNQVIKDNPNKIKYKDRTSK